MNDDEDKTLIQTEEDRKKLEERLLGKRPEDASADESSEKDSVEKPGD